MKFQLVSDIHLEFRKDFKIIPLTEILILCGDICPIIKKYKSYLKNFLYEQNKNFKVVLYVLGNHEFYGNSYNETIEKITNLLKKYKNIHLMNRNEYKIDNYIFLGCTLWSCIPNEKKNLIRNSINDYRFIKNWTTEHNNQYYIDDSYWLEKKLDELEESKFKIIILTHHSPYFKNISDPKFDDTLKEVYATDMSDLFIYDNLKIWCYGHSHFSNYQLVDDVKLISNQVGYPYEKNTRYNQDLVIEI